MDAAEHDDLFAGYDIENRIRRYGGVSPYNDDLV